MPFPVNLYTALRYQLHPLFERDENGTRPCRDWRAATRAVGAGAPTGPGQHGEPYDFAPQRRAQVARRACFWRKCGLSSRGQSLPMCWPSPGIAWLSGMSACRSPVAQSRPQPGAEQRPLPGIKGGHRLKAQRCLELTRRGHGQPSTWPAHRNLRPLNQPCCRDSMQPRPT